MLVLFFVARSNAATCCIRSKTWLPSEYWLTSRSLVHQLKCSRAICQAPGNTTEAGGRFLKAEAYPRYQMYQATENVNALKKATFKHAPKADQQHLEVGCGAGGFTKSHVLQHCSPCLRLVAVDKSPAMIQVAQKMSQHPRIYYDILDIETGDVDSFVNKYGRFYRIYSFLCFHFLKNQRAGYVNVRRLLVDDGECFVNGCLHTSFFDAWHELHTNEKWKHFTPDPVEGFPNMRCSDNNVYLTNLESEVRDVVASAGLQCLDCQVYKSNMEFPDAEAAADMVIAVFDLEARVPPKVRSQFRNAWRDALLKVRTKVSAGCALSCTFYTVRAAR